MNTVNVAYGMAHGNSASTPSLIILSGLPGTGKTTFAHALVAVLHAAHVESDAIRRALRPQPTYTHAENAAVFARVEAAARKSLEAAQHTIIDATNLTTGDRKRFVHLAHHSDARLIFVRVTAPEDIVKQRLAHQREGFSQATAAIYDRMKGRAQPFTGPAVIVDTSYPLMPSIALVAALVSAWPDDGRPQGPVSRTIRATTPGATP